MSCSLCKNQYGLLYIMSHSRTHSTRGYKLYNAMSYKQIMEMERKNEVIEGGKSVIIHNTIVDSPLIDVRYSDIHGLGVFAATAIPKNVTIGRYRGVELSLLTTPGERLDQARRGGYAFQCGKDLLIDGDPACMKGNTYWEARINASYKTGKRTNVRFTRTGGVKTVVNIPAGRELLLSYGAEYWRR